MWQRRRERERREPLIHLRLLGIPPLRSGLGMFLFQNIILMGIFFAIPLYLQIVQGFDAFQTGAADAPGLRHPVRDRAGRIAAGGALSGRAGSSASASGCCSPRRVLLLSTIKPDIETVPFGIAMAVLGVGMGLIVSQLGNVVQSAVGEDDRGEVGGLQYTAQQLGASLGTALIGAVVITGLITGFSNNIGDDPRISSSVEQQVGVKLEGDVSFVSTDQVRNGAQKAGLDQATTNALVENYSDAQLTALKTGLLFAGFLVCAAFLTTRRLPSGVPTTRGSPEAAPA